MLKHKFKTCIINEQEQYIFATAGRNDQSAEMKSVRFPGSLLSFVDLEMDTLADSFHEMNEWFCRLPGKEAVDELVRILEDLTERHIYFELFRLEWVEKIEQPHPEDSLQKLWQQEVQHIPETLLQTQNQVKDLIARVLDIDAENRPVPERMISYGMSESAFQFQPQSTRFEPWNSTVFTEVIYPESMYDLISYHLQECVERELRFRVCRNCGRYFNIIGRKTAIYCHRPFGNNGGTCRGVGSIFAWTQKRRQDEVFISYRREYKRRFAWIRADKIAKDDFYAWSKLAREKKKECDAGEISCEVFDAWLRKS